MENASSKIDYIEQRIELAVLGQKWLAKNLHKKLQKSTNNQVWPFSVLDRSDLLTFMHITKYKIPKTKRLKNDLAVD